MENLVTPNVRFWRDKRVFLTGHTGFKGAWLALWLKQLGAKVFAYSLEAPSNPSLYEILDLASLLDGDTQGDVRNLVLLNEKIQEADPEVVFHLAAQSLVRPSYEMPLDTYSTNVMGTANLLEACRAGKSLRAIVNVTTDKCYENKEWHWGYRENDPLGGEDPYSSSKACSEIVTHAYRQSFFEKGEKCGLASARAGNVIGGGDWALDRLLPDFFRAMFKGEPLEIRNPHSTRPWQHVLEPLSGYLCLAERVFDEPKSYSQGWNFGPEGRDAQPVSSVVEIIQKQWGDGARAHVADAAKPQPHEAKYLKLDCSKTNSVLGWYPRLTLTKALEWTVEWYKAYQASSDVEPMRSLCIKQIDTYASMTRGME